MVHVPDELQKKMLGLNCVVFLNIWSTSSLMCLTLPFSFCQFDPLLLDLQQSLCQPGTTGARALTSATTELASLRDSPQRTHYYYLFSFTHSNEQRAARHGRQLSLHLPVSSISYLSIRLSAVSSFAASSICSLWRNLRRAQAGKVVWPKA